MKRSLESFASAQATIGRLEKGMHLFALTRGQFSMLDIVLHCVAEIGPAHVSVWTWAIADYEVEAMEGLIRRQGILSGRLVVDISAERRKCSTIDLWRSTFGPESVRTVKNHAKIARVWNDSWRLLIRGSMNLNFNPRFEQLDISEGCAGFDLVERVEAEIPVLPRNASNAEADAATRVGRAFEAKTLQLFGGGKVWSK